MFEGYTLDEQAARERHLLLLHEAEVDRTLRALRANGLQRAGLRRQLADRLGDFFIGLGHKLKQGQMSKKTQESAS